MFIEASRGAGAQSVTVDWLWVRSPLEEMIYLFIFPFLRSGVQAKPGVDFRHSTRNASRTWRKVGSGVTSLCLLYVGYSVKLKISYFNK